MSMTIRKREPKGIPTGGRFVGNGGGHGGDSDLHTCAPADDPDPHRPKGIPRGGEYRAMGRINPDWLEEPEGLPLERKGRAWYTPHDEATVDATRSSVDDGIAEAVARQASILADRGWDRILVKEDTIMLATPADDGSGDMEYWHIWPHQGEASHTRVSARDDRERELDSWSLGPHDRGDRKRGDDPAYDALLQSLSGHHRPPAATMRRFLNTAMRLDDHPWKGAGR